MLQHADNIIYPTNVPLVWFDENIIVAFPFLGSCGAHYFFVNLLFGLTVSLFVWLSF
jgi:hypothetical protein